MQQIHRHLEQLVDGQHRAEGRTLQLILLKRKQLGIVTPQHGLQSLSSLGGSLLGLILQKFVLFAKIEAQLAEPIIALFTS